MKDRKTERYSIWNEVVGFEERLRSGAARAGMMTRDSELASVLTRIGRRRRSRSDATKVLASGDVYGRAPEAAVSRGAVREVASVALAAPASGASARSRDAGFAGSGAEARGNGNGNGDPGAADASLLSSGSRGPARNDAAVSGAAARSEVAARVGAAAPESRGPARTDAAPGNRGPARSDAVSGSGVAARSGVVVGVGATASPGRGPAAAGEPGTVLSVTRIAGSVAMLKVTKPAGLRFVAGQHLKISIPGHGKNPYSIASAPSDPQLDLCVERIPGGRVSTQLYALEPGMRLELDSQPKGKFVLQPKAAIHLMLATVTGIAPFRSILREAAALKQWPYFVVLHGASFADELPYRQELEALAQRFPQNVRYLPSVSRPSDLRNRNFQGLTGRLTDLAPSLVRELQASRPGQAIQVYACGHPDMVSTVSTTLGSMGFNVISEVFD